MAALHSMLAAGKDIGPAWGFGTRIVKGGPRPVPLDSCTDARGSSAAS